MLPRVRRTASRQEGVPSVLGYSHPIPWGRWGGGQRKPRVPLCGAGPVENPGQGPTPGEGTGGWGVGVSLDGAPRDTGAAPKAPPKPSTLTASLGRQLPRPPRLTDAETEAQGGTDTPWPQVSWGESDVARAQPQTTDSGAGTLSSHPRTVGVRPGDPCPSRLHVSAQLTLRTQAEESPCLRDQDMVPLRSQAAHVTCPPQLCGHAPLDHPAQTSC